MKVIELLGPALIPNHVCKCIMSIVASRRHVGIPEVVELVCMHLGEHNVQERAVRTGIKALVEAGMLGYNADMQLMRMNRR